jgi:hypothetical protein
VGFQEGRMKTYRELQSGEVQEREELIHFFTWPELKELGLEAKLFLLDQKAIKYFSRVSVFYLQQFLYIT